jgi:pimeloyl-ACP methyl ester carboxylesterase
MLAHRGIAEFSTSGDEVDVLGFVPWRRCTLSAPRAEARRGRSLDERRLVTVTTFVLIPGAWMGGWVWEPMVDRLRKHDHDVHVVTLSGLSRPNEDWSHIGIATHVNDVLALLRERGLRDVIMVGHGTSGVIAGVVADRAPDCVVHTVYIEAFLPHSGKSTLDAFAGLLRAHELRSITENHGRWPIPDVAVVGEGQGLSAEQAQWLVERLVDHPGRPLTEPICLTHPLETQQATYVVCRMEHFDERLADDVERMRAVPGWSFRYLDTGLWPMISAPDELLELLEEVSITMIIHPSPAPSPPSHAAISIRAWSPTTSR